jgi:hypothetical protein
MRARHQLATCLAALRRVEARAQIGVREFLWLCLPALLVGLALRAHFLWVTPQGYFGADSRSYFHFSHELFIDGEFDLSPKRRWLYPIILTLLTPLPIASWYLVPIVQHLLGLATIVGIGWITSRLCLLPRLSVPLVTLLCAIWPRMLWYEHEFVAESFVLAAFVLTVCLALIPGVFQSNRGLTFLFLSMILLAGFKAVGRFFWLGAIVASLIYAGDPRRWAWSLRSGLAAIASLIVAATVGHNSQGYWLLLNSILPLVQESGEPHARYRTALRPLILEARRSGNNYPWIKYKYKKVLNPKDLNQTHPDWAELLKDTPRFTTVARNLSMETIRKHPTSFARYTVSSFAIATLKPGVESRFDPVTFWKDQLEKAKRIEHEPTYIGLALRVDQQAMQRLAFYSRNKKYRLLDFHRRVDAAFRPLQQPPSQQGLATVRIRPFGWLVALGLFLSLRPSLLRRAALLLIPSMVYAVGVFAVGDAVPRYLQPIEWVGFILGILALEFLIHHGMRFSRTLLHWLKRRRVSQDSKAKSQH